MNDVRRVLKDNQRAYLLVMSTVYLPAEIRHMIWQWVWPSYMNTLLNITL